MPHYSADNTATKLEQALPSPAPQPAAPRDPAVGTSLLGRYLLEDVLGEGGSSVIYRGVHTTIGRTVAIKMLRPELVRNEETVARFLREGRAACRVRHEHVVEATDFGVTPDGDVFLVMEYLEGEDLAALLEREGPLPWPRARAIALQICEAIDAAHAAGVIHRDITLQNCFRVNRERNPDYIKVIDFGIAKMLESSTPDTDECGVTGNAEIFGTPEYMAPEQVRRTIDADRRSDVYALGAVLYALVTGRLPLRGSTALDTLVRQIYEEVVPPSTLVSGIPAQLEAAILRALAKDPDERFQSMAELATALERVPVLGLVDRSPQPVRAVKPPSVVIGGTIESPLANSVTATDLDLPELGEHDIRNERPADRLLGRPRRAWLEMRWPAAAVAACALVLVGVHALGRDPAPSAPPPTSVQASAAVGGGLPAPELAPSRTPRADTDPAIAVPTTSATTLPERTIAVAEPRTAPAKPDKPSRRGSSRRGESDVVADLPDVAASAVGLAPVTDTPPAAAEATETIAEPAAPTAPAQDGAADAVDPYAPPQDEAEAAEETAVPSAPTPDPFASSDAADEIKDPFSAPK